MTTLKEWLEKGHWGASVLLDGVTEIEYQDGSWVGHWIDEEGSWWIDVLEDGTAITWTTSE